MINIQQCFIALSECTLRRETTVFVSMQMNKMTVDRQSVRLIEKLLDG